VLETHLHSPEKMPCSEFTPRTLPEELDNANLLVN